MTPLGDAMGGHGVPGLDSCQDSSVIRRRTSGSLSFAEFDALVEGDALELDDPAFVLDPGVPLAVVFAVPGKVPHGELQSRRLEGCTLMRHLLLQCAISFYAGSRHMRVHGREFKAALAD